MNLEQMLDKFSVAVPESGCWIWTGTLGGNGYGFYAKWTNGKRYAYRAHRKVYELAYGSIRPGMFVCHRCDVPLCVNPKHLFLGTCADNNADKKRKGRSAVGSRHGQAKLREEWIPEIRASAECLHVLAKKYGVSKISIWQVKHGKTWIHADCLK